MTQVKTIRNVVKNLQTGLKDIPTAGSNAQPEYVRTKSLKIGGVLFEGFELLDIYGPLEMLGLLGDSVVITMFAAEAGDIASSAGVKGVADKPLSEAAGLDVLLIPGGIGTRTLVGNNRFLELLRTAAGESRFVASICTGSALLARTGLLDGLRATSNKIAFDWVTQQGPSVHWIRQARWVEDGCFFTSSGISAGIDMTLGLISRLHDREASVAVAKRAEYLWNEDQADDPFSV
jgi:transcriptional regulator GlxA family with amidase domain